MKVLHLSSAVTWRGGEQQLAYLLEELPSRQVQNAVLCPQKSPLHEYCLKHGIPHETFKPKPFKKWNGLLALKRACQKEKPALLHAHDSHSHSIAWLAHETKVIQTPLVISRRVDFPIGGNRLSRKKYNHPSLQKIICVSEAIRKIIAPQIKDPKKICVVHDGMDPARFATDESRPSYPLSPQQKKQGRLRQSLGIPEEHFLIGKVAALAPHKDYPTFVKTAELLLRENLPAHFLLIGRDDGCQREIEQLIAQSRQPERFHLLGFRNDIPYILPELDLFLFTSKTEGLGSSLLDALYCGVPIVSTAAGGIPEIIQHEKNGLLAPVGDATSLARSVKRLLEEPALRNKLVKQGRETVKAFSKAEMARKTVEVYSSCQSATTGNC